MNVRVKDLDCVVQRMRKVAARQYLTVIWGCAAIVLGIVKFVALPSPEVFVCGTVGIAGGLSLWVCRPRSFSAEERRIAARLIDSKFPELAQRVVTWLDQQPDPSTGRYSVLQRQLAHEIRSHADVYDWSTSVPIKRVRVSGLSFVATASLSAVLAYQAWFLPARHANSATAGEIAANTSIPAGSTVTVAIEPGNTEIERGSNLLILARFEGPLPAAVALHKHEQSAGSAARLGDEATGSATKASNELASSPAESRLEMTKSLDDPVFGLRIPNVDRSFLYEVSYDDRTSETFTVEVFELPRVDRVDARIQFPSYAGLPDDITSDTWQVSAVEGATVLLTCQLNKRLSTGKLTAEDGQTFQLDLMETAPAVIPSAEVAETDGDPIPALRETGPKYLVRIPVTRSMKLHFELKDERGRANRDPGEFRITALPNRPPEIKLTFPGKDLRVSPLEEMLLQAKVWDDFGLRQHGLIVALADRDPQTITLSNSAAAREAHDVEHMLSLEQLRAEPDQLVSYYFFADDVAADGSERRTLSDMYFAEVRHFEEIFREGQAPPGGGGGQQGNQQTQRLEQLGNDQKQIINATWKIMRRETAAELTATFALDVQLVLESQQALSDNFEEQAGKLSDPKSQKYAADVLKAMRAAVEALLEAHAGPQRESLTPALAAERAAYDALLKLRAREHQVIQSQQNGGGQGGGSSGPSQQQLAQLELNRQKNRYEAERRAGEQSPQAAENREELQVLSRLRELAQRQSDVNQKLQEVEHALREAKTDNEREELERQLKRLRDEQRDMLRDVDELRERMDRPENQQRMADARDKLEDTRSKVRESSQALEDGRLSQALSSGTRAERELQQLRDDFRQRAAGQFDESMRQLRQEARELNQRQDELAQALQDSKPAPQRSLRTVDNRQQLAEELNEQRQRLNQVVDQAREIIEQAEPGEPLLSKELYDAVRRTWQDKPGEALDATRELLRRGLTQEARQAEQQANQGLDRLQEGIERASQLVLGDELEALQRAREQVQRLNRAVSEELAQNDPRQSLQGASERNASENKASADDSQDTAGAGDPASQRRSERQTGNSQSGQRSQQDGEQRNQQRQSGNGEQKQNSGEENQSQSSNQEGREARAGQAGQGQSQQNQQQAEENGRQSDSQAGGSPGRGQASQRSDQTGQSSSPSESGSPSPSQSASTNQSSQAAGQGEQSGNSGGSSRGQPNANSRRRPGLGNPSTGQQSADAQASGASAGGNEQRGGHANGPGGPEAAPLTGAGFNDWSDRLREVEESVTDPQLRNDVARIREAARSLRVAFKRHSQEPAWDLVRMQLIEPLTEIEKRIADEIARQQSPDSLVPLDKDPVPERYSELVRQYYERLGSGR